MRSASQLEKAARERVHTYTQAFIKPVIESNEE